MIVVQSTVTTSVDSPVTVHYSAGARVPEDKVAIIVAAIPRMLQALGIPHSKISVYLGGANVGRENAHAKGNFATGNGTISYNTGFLKRASLPGLLDVTAHELIHVWQEVAGHKDTRDADDWWYRGKKYKASTRWEDAPWEQEAVLNSWALVSRAGLADGLKQDAMDFPHYGAKRNGKKANLFIKHLYD